MGITEKIFARSSWGFFCGESSSLLFYWGAEFASTGATARFFNGFCFFVRQESLKLFGLKHFKCLIFDATDFLYVPATWIPILSSPSQSALPYARSSLWAISKPLTSCLSALLAICSPALAFLVGGQTSTDSTHV